MLSISFSVFHSVVYLRTKQGRKNWLRSASNIFGTLILVKMASLRRNNVSQPISFISEETNIFVSTMLIIDVIFETKNILNAVNSFCWFDKGYSGIIPESQNVFLSYPGFVIRVVGHVIRMTPSSCLGYQTACSGEVRVTFGHVETPYRGQGKSTSSSREIHGHISHTRPLSQPASLLCFKFLFASKHTQLINKSKQRRISSFWTSFPGFFLCKGKSVRRSCGKRNKKINSEFFIACCGAYLF